MIVSIISIILLVVLSIILLLLYKWQKRKLKKEFIEHCETLFNQELEKKKQQLEEEAEEYQKRVLHKCEEWRNAQIAEREQIDRSLKERRQAVEEIIEQLENRRREAEKAYQETIKNEKEKIDIDLNCYHQLRLGDIDIQLTKIQEEKMAAAKKVFDEQTAELENQKREKTIELAILLEEIDDFKKKQTVINEEILRRRELEEKQEFFKIKLPECDKQDIKYLLSVIDNIKNSTLVYKLIWSEYIQKPFNQMTKNITGGKEIKCVIYKITNTNTGEIYIGKTKADVTKRWTEHIKTSLNIGTVARSKIHNALFNHWDEFTFEILEKVDDETKLSTREKFYINFYESNIYGYNMNSGG